MNNESGRGAGDFLLVILVILLAVIFAILLLGGFRGQLVPHLFGSWDPFGVLDHHGFPRLIWGFWGFGGLLSLILAVWVGLDASRKGMSGVLWGVLVFLTSIVGLIVYLIVASTTDGRGKRVADGPAATVAPPPAAPVPPTPAAPAAAPACAGCGATVQPDFRVCPYCSRPLGTRCPGCDRPVETDWKVCPHCGRSLEKGTFRVSPDRD